jgi:serine/threonine protein kinase
MAPEILFNYIDETSNIIYKYEVDIWSIGIIIYELLFHRKPFGWSSYHNICKSNPTDPEFIKKCLDAPLEFPTSISKEAQDFLTKTLCKNPQERASIDQLLMHPWILNHLKTKKLSNERCPLRYDLTQIKNQTIAHSIHSDKKISKNQCLLS